MLFWHAALVVVVGLVAGCALILAGLVVSGGRGRVRKGLSLVGQVIYVVVVLATVVADVVIQVALFANGEIGWAVVYLFVGWTVTLTVGHWVGLLLAAPFAVAGSTRRR